WQENDSATARSLHHGAFDWDTMNLRGLDFEHNKDLTWLKPGEPRRMFMGGGSDAHGDLNYRRAGYFLGTDDANDPAIGKPRKLVFVGDPQGQAIALPFNGELADVSPVGTVSTAPVSPSPGLPSTTPVGTVSTTPVSASPVAPTTGVFQSRVTSGL